MFSRSVLLATGILLVGTVRGGPRLEVDDPNGAAAATLAPVSVKVLLPDSLVDAAKTGNLTVTERPGGNPVPAQYEGGRVWWMMPAGKPGNAGLPAGNNEQSPIRGSNSLGFPAVPRAEVTKRVFELGAGGFGANSMTVKEDAGRFICMDGDAPVLCYNFRTVPVPPGATGKYAVARSDYVHPIYGPGREVLTADFPKGHPHHRGLYWAWPEVMYKGQKRDLHALQGVFARPVKIVRRESGPVLACIEAENVWKWGDKEPIVREWATIRAFRRGGADRVLDFTFRFEAIQPGVTIARRGTNHYGGINLRLSPRRDQKIRTTPAPKKAWAELVGVPNGGKSPIGVTILQYPSNPRFPGDWQPYPKLNWLQPTFPSKGERYELKVGAPLVLRCRLVVHPGAYDDARLNAMFEAYQSAEPTK